MRPQSLKMYSNGHVLVYWNHLVVPVTSRSSFKGWRWSSAKWPKTRKSFSGTSWSSQNTLTCWRLHGPSFTAAPEWVSFCSAACFSSASAPFMPLLTYFLHSSLCVYKSQCIWQLIPFFFITSTRLSAPSMKSSPLRRQTRWRDAPVCRDLELSWGES